MKNIAYIELDTHAEIALNFMELMAGSSDFHLDFWFSEKIARQFQQNEESKVFCLTFEQ